MNKQNSSNDKQQYYKDQTNPEVISGAPDGL